MLVVFEGLLLSFWLLLICVVGIAKDGPVGLVVFYEQEVQNKVVELGLITKEKIKQISIITSLALFLPMLTVIPLTVYFYNGVSGFLDGFIQLAGIYLIAGLFDRISNTCGNPGMGYAIGRIKLLLGRISMNAREYLDILHIAERLKDTPRHCTTTKRRTESVAEQLFRSAGVKLSETLSDKMTRNQKYPGHFFAIEQPANARYYKDMHQSEKHNMEKGGKKK